MAYHIKTGEILQGSFGVDPADFDCQTDGAGGVLITAWRSGISQPTEAQVVTAFNADPTGTAFQTAIATAQAGTIGRATAIRKTASQNNSTVTLADVADLRWPLKANSHYAYQFVGAYSTAATATGLAVAVNGPASPTLVRMVVCIAETATTQRNGTAAAYNTAVIGAASLGATALPFWVDGNISTGAASGFFTLRFASEVAASQVTILSGSYGLLYAIG